MKGKRSMKRPKREWMKVRQDDRDAFRRLYAWYCEYGHAPVAQIEKDLIRIKALVLQMELDVALRGGGAGKFAETAVKHALKVAIDSDAAPQIPKG